MKYLNINDNCSIFPYYGSHIQRINKTKTKKTLKKLFITKTKHSKTIWQNWSCLKVLSPLSKNQLIPVRKDKKKSGAGKVLASQSKRRFIKILFETRREKGVPERMREKNGKKVEIMGKSFRGWYLLLPLLKISTPEKHIYISKYCYSLF